MNPLFAAAIGVVARKRQKDKEKARAHASAAAHKKRVSGTQSNTRPANAGPTKKEK